MNAAFQRLLTALRRPESVRSLTESEWDALLRHSRSAGLLSRLALDIQALGAWEALPERVRRHMRGAVHIAERQIRAVRWEIHRIHEALGDLGIPIVLLKGAAYVMADLPAARGRLFSDIDILVPREHLDSVEMRLMLHGWHGTHRDAYDQRYYREWMHEIPPVRHIERGSTLDIHHAILPITARLKPQTEDLLTCVQPIGGYVNLYRLGDADLLLHSATHLFHEGEWAHGLRDLVDLDTLLRHFGKQPGFLTTLDARAHLLGLQTPLRHALYFTSRLLGTPGGERNAHRPPQGPFAAPFFVQAFASAHPETSGPGTPPALLFLYLRSHWLRMPLNLLVPHLLRKSWVGLKDRDTRQ